MLSNTTDKLIISIDDVDEQKDFLVELRFMYFMQQNQLAVWKKQCIISNQISVDILSSAKQKNWFDKHDR